MAPRAQFIQRALTVSSCDSGYQVCAILSVFGRAAVLIVWGARTYAVFNRSRAIIVILVPLGVFTMVLATLYIPYIACNGSRGNPPAVTSYLNLCTVLFETLSALLTTVRVMQGARVAGAWRLHRRGLLYLVFKEGASVAPRRAK
ncbi:hypothetical protein HYPSUDRAFT_145762 [Hypholoma sublateritium FD-334 SS-4]|uniref:Uncharacterized protein n=1 Tax=Hypholoma sublateritium (strain FD-334 SS-4) TaxID=945553 RepID=A0A0D2NG53_HYPSF|nr:hypothetical protein HYPSUDRAFT_145762 [Hypholoma sublateritium FD-334 SS-4]